MTEIRFARKEDAPAILEIYEYYIENTAITFEEAVPSISDFEKRIENISKGYPYLVLEVDGKIEGYAYSVLFHGRSAYSHSVETTIYLRKDMQRSGYGTLLYEKMEGILKSQNVTNLYACIASTTRIDEHLDNTSILFHEKMGYRTCGIFKNSGRKFEKWYDVIYMEKIIGDNNSDIDDFIPISKLKR